MVEIVNQIYLDAKKAMVYIDSLPEPVSIGTEIVIAGHLRKVTDITFYKTWACITWDGK